MATWTSGYMSDIEYTYGYYRELNPLWMQTCLLQAGYRCPHIENACELGFGQGISANFHAAASDINWYGTDFNPGQACFARELALKSGSSAKFYDDSFADFCCRKDLPDFDYISLHGIWSWVSRENREVITEFVSRKLRPGGILYVSYNTLPGWSTFAPVRHIMTQFEQITGSRAKGISGRIDESLAFTKTLVETDPSYVRAHPQIKERLESLFAHNRNYLAHEFFNADWNPMYFSDLAKSFEMTKLEFGASGGLREHFGSINYNDRQQALLNGTVDTVLKESIKDFILNQGFRRDYWVKGLQPLTSLEKIEQLQKSRFVLLSDPDFVTFTIETPLGTAQMSKDVYVPLIALMQDYRPRTLLEVANELKSSSVSFSQLSEAIMLLCDKGNMSPAYSEDQVDENIAKAWKLNEYLIHQARSRIEVQFLVSPLTGQGIKLNRIHMLIAGEYMRDITKSDEIVSRIWSLLKLQNQNLIVEGKTCQTEAENLQELAKLVENFSADIAPVLKGARILQLK